MDTKTIRDLVAFNIIAYLITHKEEKEEIIKCAETLDKIFAWNIQTEKEITN